MAKKSLLDKITSKKAPAAAVPEETAPAPNEADAENQNQQVEGDVDHLWIKEDIDAEKPPLVKDPRIDTGILRNRIADKISKMNNN